MVMVMVMVMTTTQDDITGNNKVAGVEGSGCGRNSHSDSVCGSGVAAVAVVVSMLALNFIWSSGCWKCVYNFYFSNCYKGVDRYFIEKSRKFAFSVKCIYFSFTDAGINAFLSLQTTSKAKRQFDGWGGSFTSSSSEEVGKYVLLKLEWSLFVFFISS